MSKPSSRSRRRRRLFNSLDPKFFQQAALNHCCRCSLEHRDFQSVFTGVKMLCYRRIRLVLHCKAVAIHTFPEGATSLPQIDCVAFGMATGDDSYVNHRCGRASEVFLDKVVLFCLLSKRFDISNNLTCLAAGDLTRKVPGSSLHLPVPFFSLSVQVHL